MLGERRFPPFDELTPRRHPWLHYPQSVWVQWFVANHEERRLQRPDASPDRKGAKFTSGCQFSKKLCSLQVGVCIPCVLSPSDVGKSKGVSVDVLALIWGHTQAELLGNLDKMLLSAIKPD